MKSSVFCGVSLDGFLARPDDTFDFLKAGEGVPHGFTEFLNSVDVIVIGREHSRWSATLATSAYMAISSW